MSNEAALAANVARYTPQIFEIQQQVIQDLFPHYFQEVTEAHCDCGEEHDTPAGPQKWADAAAEVKQIWTATMTRFIEQTDV